MADFEINKQNTLSQSSRLTEVGGTVKRVKSMVSNANSGLVGIGLGGVVPSLVAIEARLAKHAAKQGENPYRKLGGQSFGKRFGKNFVCSLRRKFGF